MLIGLKAKMSSRSNGKTAMTPATVTVEPISRRPEANATMLVRVAHMSIGWTELRQTTVALSSDMKGFVNG